MQAVLYRGTCTRKKYGSSIFSKKAQRVLLKNNCRYDKMLYDMEKEKQNIAFFYLKTGGGHFAGARAVSERMTELYPDIACVTKDAFETGVPFSKTFAEKGYALTTNYFQRGYVLFYQITNAKPVLDYVYNRLQGFFNPLLRKFLLEHNITKIVSFHEILTPYLVNTVAQLKTKIPIISVVMDPFTAHNSWFYSKDLILIVFSKYLQAKAINEFGYAPESVHCFAPILSKQFDCSYSESKKADIRRNLNIPDDKKVLLIAGGGEGLKNAGEILTKFLDKKFNDSIIIVCGKNKRLKQRLEKIVKKYNADHVIIFGFVNFMPDLMNIANCVISKGGPGTIMETLRIAKPLIICDFVRGQEYGNVFYVEQHRVGWYLRDPEKIYAKVSEIFTSPEIEAEIKARIQSLELKNGLDDIVKFIAEN